MPGSRSAISSPKLLMTVPTTGPVQRPSRCARARHDIEELIAIDDAAQVVDHHQAVAVAIQRDARHARARPAR